MSACSTATVGWPDAYKVTAPFRPHVSLLLAYKVVCLLLCAALDNRPHAGVIPKSVYVMPAVSDGWPPGCSRHAPVTDLLKAALGSWSARLTEQDYHRLVQQGFDSQEALFDARDKSHAQASRRCGRCAGMASRQQAKTASRYVAIHCMITSL